MIFRRAACKRGLAGPIKHNIRKPPRLPLGARFHTIYDAKILSVKPVQHER
jgi:hypothetical protein